jgi:hypothetical protein
MSSGKKHTVSELIFALNHIENYATALQDLEYSGKDVSHIMDHYMIEQLVSYICNGHGAFSRFAAKEIERLHDLDSKNAEVL